MGIKGLLKVMKPYISPIHIAKYSGERVGIDAYSWMHKGAYSCSMELALHPKSDKAKRYLQYFMHHINLLRHYKITPVVVFDGGSIPCKSATANERRRRRNENLSLAKQELHQGNVGAAVELFQKAVSITPTMAYQLIQILRLENVEFVVAPYEADSQLAYLTTIGSDQGGIAAVITEDSDLMAYGCKSVIFKMDRHGNAEEILMDKVLNSESDEFSFRHFDIELFTGMCILAGCDFLPSVPDIGIKRAYNLVLKYKNLDRALSALKFQKGKQMPEDYIGSFKKALAVFHHARIYDFEAKTLKPMKPLPEKLLLCLDGDLNILGPDLQPSVAVAIAEGRMNPITMKSFDQSTSHVMDPISTRTPNHSRNQKVQTDQQGSCFNIFSSSEMNEEKITVMEHGSLGNLKYSSEVLALGKLFSPLNSHQKEVKSEAKRDFPDNNPFKKRRFESVDSDAKETVEDAKQTSVLTNVHNEIIDFPTPESQESVNSKPASAKRLGFRNVINEKKAKNVKRSNTSVRKNSSITKFFMRTSSQNL